MFQSNVYCGLLSTLKLESTLDPDQALNWHENYLIACSSTYTVPGPAGQQILWFMLGKNRVD
jgi:hypothetical protein